MREGINKILLDAFLEIRRSRLPDELKEMYRRHDMNHLMTRIERTVYHDQETVKYKKN
jgi:hypothetical protein